MCTEHMRTYFNQALFYFLVPTSTMVVEFLIHQHSTSTDFITRVNNLISVAKQNKITPVRKRMNKNKERERIYCMI